MWRWMIVDSQIFCCHHANEPFSLQGRFLDYCQCSDGSCSGRKHTVTQWCVVCVELSDDWVVSLKVFLGVTWCTCTFLKASFICVLSPLRWFWIQVQLPPDWGPSTSGGVQAFQQDLPQQKQQGYEIIKTEQRRRYSNCRVSRFIFSLSWLLTCSLHVLI